VYSVDKAAGTVGDALELAKAARGEDPEKRADATREVALMLRDHDRLADSLVIAKIDFLLSLMAFFE
jgi:hypothetical protein